MMTINVVVAGPRGKMGTEAIKMINNVSNFNLVACIDRINNGKKLNDISSFPNEIPIFDDPNMCLQSIDVDVVLDLTIPNIGFEIALFALEYSVAVVSGTSGFTKGQLNELDDIAQKNKTGCLIAPNFAIGAVLMMQFAKTASKYFKNVEIIEMHHDEKIDAPSGTLMNTINIINEAREEFQQGHPDEYETVQGVRGGNINGIRVHSVRLPGSVAQQEVRFGGEGQFLKIQHDSFHRTSFMEGVELAINEVINQEKLLYGLEHILDM